MSTIQICHPAPADVAAMQALWQAAFTEDAHSGYVTWYFANRFAAATTWLLKLNGSAAAMAFAPTHTLLTPDGPVAVPYLQGIATLPDLQGRGLCHKLLSRVFADLTAANYPCCVLKPFDAAFYEPLGFKFFAYLRQYKLNFANCFLQPHTDDISFVQHQSCAAADDAAQIYAAWLSQTPCYARRTPADFKLLLADHFNDRGSLLMAYAGNRPVAYALYSATANGLFIRELACTNPRAATNLLRRIAADYRDTAPCALLIAPDDYRLCMPLPQTTAGWQVVPFAMYKPLTAAPQECYNQIKDAYFYEYF